MRRTHLSNPLVLAEPPCAQRLLETLHRLGRIRADGAQHPGHGDAVAAMQKLHEAMLPVE